MPGGIPYPWGDIRVLHPNLIDISGGMQWNMQQADNVQFLAVSGTMVVGDVRAKYDFTLVVYQMHIDEVAWTIFSTLDNALATEFTEYFWKTVNFRRKDRRGFVDVSWSDTQQQYDVAEAYREVRLSVFNNLGHTVRFTTPFIYKNTYLKVHPNGAAVFAEDKKFEFLLPWIIETHNLLPSTPVFWSRDDKTIPLYRQTLWLHEDTIKWLAETGEGFPSALHDQIAPRISEFKSQSSTKTELPAEGSRQMRWKERAPTKVDTHAAPDPPPQAAQSAQLTPLQTSDDVRRYMELQAAVLNLGHQSIASSQLNSQPMATPEAAKPQPEVKADSATPAAGNATLPSNTTTVENKSKDSTAVPADCHGQPTKVTAQSLADVRPAAPPTPMTTEPTEGTPDTGVIPSGSIGPPTTDEPSKQGEARQPPSPIVEISVGASPAQSPADSPDTPSPDTLASDTVIASSPEPGQEDITAMDIETLQAHQYMALETVQELTNQLARAQSHAWSLTKRLKTMRENPRGALPPEEAGNDTAMERMD